MTSVDASADFESTDALSDNQYYEGGMAFSRTGLPFNNNGCGYAGCGYHTGFYPGFSGNYMSLVESGTFSLTSVDVVGFSSVDGFDTLRFNAAYCAYPALGGYGAPAFDTVRAQ